MGCVHISWLVAKKPPSLGTRIPLPRARETVRFPVGSQKKHIGLDTISYLFTRFMQFELPREHELSGCFWASRFRFVSNTVGEDISSHALKGEIVCTKTNREPITLVSVSGVISTAAKAEQEKKKRSKITSWTPTVTFAGLSWDKKGLKSVNFKRRTGKEM